ncbi:calcium-binding protein [Amaricoccus sp.]|uniref:calcium-binding protein n=1 Tax=Amaricoccus sp. TaxID=1872485 RepID=UPI001B5962CC|nr:calcium-binding protein [Amaricoccus sp.]MBP7002325.1 hypothetical protein [Amaricoccus sp.]
MAAFIVTTSADSGAGSLRQAVLDANAAAGADEIRFDAAVFDGEAADVIRLTSGQIEITDELTIVGGPAGVTITGDADGDDVTLAGGITDVAASLAGDDRLEDNSRIFGATAALTLDGLTVTGGRTTADGEAGGAVRGTDVTLIDSVVSGNSTAGDYARGGGVYGFTTVTLRDSTVSGNSTAGEGGDGGGVWGGVVTLTNTTVSRNSTSGSYAGGGGVSGYFSVALTNSEVSGNRTEGNGSIGGGIYGYSTRLTNSTLSGNRTAGEGASGGGVFGNYVTLENSTVSGNSTLGEGARGGGVFWGGNLYGYVSLTNSIVLGNAMVSAGFGDDDIDTSPIVRSGVNIVGSDVFSGDTIVGTATAETVFAATIEIAPGVFAGVLADNGGPTRTIAIRADGPAQGAADPASATATDQRGFARDAAPDLGAFEAGAEGGLTLVGGPGADDLAGGDLADRIRGRGGNDDLRGRSGDDRILGDRGCDTIKTGAGDDTVRGGAGRDRIGGGTGDDALHGGRGCDRFVFCARFGDDVILDFDADLRGGQDRIDLRLLGITAATFAGEVEIATDDGGANAAVLGQGAILIAGVDPGALGMDDFLLA